MLSSSGPPRREEESLAEECRGGIGVAVRLLRSDVDDGLFLTSLSRFDIRCIGDGVKRGGKDASTSSSMGDSAKGWVVKGVELLR